MGGLGPLLAALIVTRLVNESVRAWAKSILRWRVPVRYYVYALGLPVVIYGFINLILALLGLAVDPSLVAQRAPAYLTTFGFVAILGGGLEEPGWRGFALPHLQRKHSALAATAIVGLVWGVWHVPLYGPLGFGVPFVLAFFYTWVYNKTGSVLLCILLHASFTPAQDHLLLLREGVPAGGHLGTVDWVVFSSYVLAAGLLVLATRGRLGKSVDLVAPRRPNTP